MARKYQRALDQKQAERAQKSDSGKSPFIRYCVTAVFCVVIATGGFIGILFSGKDDVISQNNWTISRMVSYITADQYTSKIDTVPDDEDAALADQGGSHPRLPGMQYIPASDWYSAVPNSLQSAGEIVDYLDFISVKIPLYNALPWDATSSTYIFNVSSAQQDVINYINTFGDSGLEPKSLFVREFKGDTAYTEVDGVTAIQIAVVPSLVDRTYCAAFATDTWQYKSTPDASIYGYVKDGTPRKYCIIMEKDGNTYYMPVVANDAKGHTFPGGVCQTHVQVVGYNPNTGKYTVNIGDHGLRNAQWTMADYISYLDTPVSSSEPSNLRAYFKVNVEFYRAPDNYAKVSGINNYNIIGMVAW